jgi:hypothetical protein
LHPPDLLALPLQFIVAMVAYAINERMARRIDYLLEEVRVLREVYAETTGTKRIPLTIGCADSCAPRRTVDLHRKLQRAEPFGSGSRMRSGSGWQSKERR